MLIYHAFEHCEVNIGVWAGSAQYLLLRMSRQKTYALPLRNDFSSCACKELEQTEIIAQGESLSTSEARLCAYMSIV